MQNMAAFLDNADEQDLRLLRAALDERLGLSAGRGGLRSLSAGFSVPAEIRHLTSERMEQVTRAFLAWYKAGKTPGHRRSRGRVWLAFLLIRYGGLRLGEVLSLDDRNDIDQRSGAVRVREGAERTVQIPESVLSEIVNILESPMFFSLRGEVLRLDEGYLRRKFYERARECHLPPTLLNPRALRHSRGIELLRGGVPMPVVRAFLGQSSLKPDGGYMEFSDDTADRIVQTFLTREVLMKTSARNAFTGKITRIKQDGLLAEITLRTLGGLDITAVITGESFKNLNFTEGSVAIATVKAPWVILTEKEEGLKTSARNAYMGKVKSVKTSDIAAEVVVELSEGTKVCALITRESVGTLKLAPGRDIMVMFKAFSVILNAD